MALRFDTFAAGLILLGSLVVTSFAYRALLAVEHPAHAALQVLPIGSHIHFITQAGKCVGKFATEFNIKPDVVIKSKGEIRFSYQGSIITATSNVGAFFNVLDQLVACNVTVEAANGKVTLKLLNPNPIAADGQLTFDGRVIDQHLELPGPILLRNNGNGTYRIDYSPWALFAGSYNPVIAQNALDGMQLKVVSRADDPSVCIGEGGGDRFEDAIVLDGLVEQAQALFFRMRQTPFFPPGG